MTAIRALLGLFLAAASSVAGAGTIGVLTPYMLAPTQASGGGWVVSAGSTFAQPTLRSYSASLVGGKATISAAEAMAIASRAPAALAVTATEGVLLGDAALAVARCLGAQVPLCAAGYAAYLAYDFYRTRNPSAVPGSLAAPGSLDYDPGQPPVTVDGYCITASMSTCAPDLAGIALAQYTASASPSWVSGTPAGKYTTPPTNVAGSGVLVNGHPSTLTYTMGVYSPQDQPPYSSTRTISFGITWVVGANKSCGASVDASNPAYNVAPGGPVGPDGKCPTARYNHQGITPEQARDKVLAFPPAYTTTPSTTDKWPLALKEAVETGKQSAPATISTTGPATQTGTPTSTTTTTGSTTTTKTLTPTYTYNYAGDTISYTTTQVEVTNNGGTTTTTTTTNPAPTTQDPTDPCTANPSRVGCQELGTAPSDTVPKATKTIGYVEESIGLPSSCPAPMTGPHGIVISYQPFCDVASMARPLLLAVVSLGAAMLMIGVVKGS